MIEKKKIIEFYLQQYEQDAVRRRGNNLRVKDPENRAFRLAKSMRIARVSRLGVTQLQDFHHQVRNLMMYAYKKHNNKMMEQARTEMIPALVRLDTEFLMPDQREGIDENFIRWMKKERDGQITSTPLLFLYPQYKEQLIRGQMTQMVPTRPELEFPEALAMHRKFILHIGPTNSGKTYQALDRLKTAKTGIYLGPLRLLALEVYEKMQDFGVPALMLTGQERIEDEGFRVTCATVEMADLDVHYDVAVIDEAQLMSDPDRGHSWTRALLGLIADEIHVCCSPAAEEVLKELIKLTGDEYEVNHYERKTALLFEKKPFDFPKDVQIGDALIVFSKKSVLDVAGRLEENGIEASVIYGSLPPEIRRRQMHLFTDGMTEVVVSTDAIGMGLNLPVRRIIFLQDTKYDGHESRYLNTSEVRQIGGRAGRYGIYDPGYITAFDEESLHRIRAIYEADEAPVDTVNLGFPQVLLDIDEPMDEILKVWHGVRPTEPFEKETVDEALFLYDKARKVKNRIEGFEDKRLLYKMISCPIDIKDRHVVELWLTYCMTWNADVSLSKPQLNNRERNSLLKYETYYKQLDLYYQMSSRLGKVIDEDWVRLERSKTEDKIMRFLMKDKSNYIKRCRYCGRILPIDTPFNVCNRCFHSGMRY